MQHYTTQDLGRIVVTHVNGALFVRNERKLNPNLVLAELPSETELEKVAGELGMDLHFGEGSDDFYLATLSL